jgi:hypothetical protein
LFLGHDETEHNGNSIWHSGVVHLMTPRKQRDRKEGDRDISPRTAFPSQWPTSSK